MPNIIKISPKVNIFTFIPINVLWKNNSLIYTLALREFSSRHKNMSVGLLWVIIQPVIMASLFSIIMGHDISDNHGAYFFQVLIGWGVWQTLTRFVGDGSACLEANIGLVTKVYFRRIVIPFSKILAIFFDMILLFIPIIIAMLCMQFLWHIPGISIINIKFIYVIFGTIWAFCLGLGIITFFSVITIKFKDTVQILGLISMIWMFASPIWSNRIDMLPVKYRFIGTYNPACSILSFFRHGLLNTPLVSIHDMHIQLIITACILFFGLFFFNLLERHVIEEV